jgi:hypothetical protein
LIHDFKHLRSIFAQIDGDPAAVAQHRLAAAVALRNELARRPFDPELAARYVIQDAPRLDHSEAFALLARPLRFRRPSSLYLEALDHLIARAGGPDAVLPTFDELADIPFEKDTIRWPSVYTPELLRLGAIVAFGHRDHERNIRYLTAALPYYELLGSDAALAHAACKAVLADARFHADPAKPSEAIADAQDALRLAPSSQDGRQLCDQIALRLVIYHLAADHEEHVRKIIRDRVRGLSEDDLDWEIAHQYVQLAYSLIESASAAVPDQLSRWSQRALELAPEAGLSWLLAGDLAIRAKVAERTAECARRALQFHADPKDVLGLLDRGVGAMPENTTLRQMRDALHARLQGEQPAADAQPPADTHPPADVPPLDTPIAEVGTPGVLATTNGL